VPGGIGGPELLLIFLVVLLVFGPKKIPEVAKGIGKGLREIRRLTTDLQREINLADATEERRSARPSPARPAASQAEPAAGAATEAAEETASPAPAEEGADGAADESAAAATQAYEELDEQVLDSPAPERRRSGPEHEDVKPDA
jgi:sec-independent protein translocase protein TatA